jgi:uncharacterized protein (TIRG00374 family)
MSKRKWQARGTFGIGFALSGLFLWLALRQTDFNSLVNAFANINYAPVATSAGVMALGVVLRAVRWRIIAGCPSTNHSYFTRATNLGLLANLIFPGRVGEFLKIVTLAKLSGSTLPGPLASALIDRLVDMFMLIASALVLYLIMPIGVEIEKWFIRLVVSGVLTIVFLVVFARSSGKWEAIFARIIQRWLERWQLRPEIFLMELRVEFRRIFSGWISLELGLLSLVIFSIDYLTVAVLFLAFDLPITLEAPLVLWVFLAASSVLPSAPSSIGVYQAAAVLALSFYAIPAAEGVALATVKQLTILGVVLLMNAPSMVGLLKQTLVTERSTQ